MNAPSQPLIIIIGKRFRNFVNYITTKQSLVSTNPVLDESVYDWTDNVKENWQDIAKEAQNVLRHRDAIPPLKDISPDHERIARDGNWRSFFLIGYGFKVEENCIRAPKTYNLIKKIPELNSAFFSILEPGAVIPRHRGVTRGLITCHLGLNIPTNKESCVIQVEDQDLNWENGKWLIFDDSYFHEVHNDTDERRVILLLQIIRPMKFWARLVNNFMLWGIRKTSFVKDAKKNLVHWEQAFQMAEQNEHYVEKSK